MEGSDSSLRWIERPVGRGRYVAAGVSLLALKYAVDAALYWVVFRRLWNPVDYLNPMYVQRMSVGPETPDLPAWFAGFLLAWGLVFLVLGVAWSAKRALDAGLSPWWGLFLLLPGFNYVVILGLLIAPSNPPRRLRPEHSPRRVLNTAVWGMALFGAVALVFAIVVQANGQYGLAAFLGMPFLVGVALGYLPNRVQREPVGRTFQRALLSVVVASLALMLFALEGLVCIAMALPLLSMGVGLGALLGRALAPGRDASPAVPLGLLLALPLASGVESALPRPEPHEVSSSIVVDAPPEVVWRHVIAFTELPEPDDWLFRTGVAYPQRARLEGEGVGAVRHCEFSTGAFVEPITVWDPPRRLAFDVVDYPLPMEEWSFYADLRPPHLEDSFRSVRGEFRLVPLEGGRTRLEGSTWYELELAPEVYWRPWADTIVHRIHLRVLRHVANLAEADVR